MKVPATPAPLSCCHTCGKEREEEDGGVVFLKMFQNASMT